MRKSTSVKGTVRQIVRLENCLNSGLEDRFILCEQDHLACLSHSQPNPMRRSSSGSVRTPGARRTCNCCFLHLSNHYPVGDLLGEGGLPHPSLRMEESVPLNAFENLEIRKWTHEVNAGDSTAIASCQKASQRGSPQTGSAKRRKLIFKRGANTHCFPILC